MIKLENITKVFGSGSKALTDVTLHIDPGEFVFIVGPSGSGKSTLLRMLIREVLPTSGSIHINDIDVVKLSGKKVPHLRRNIGVVFQDLKLLVDRTIFENIILPLEMSNTPRSEANEKAVKILEQVGISDQKDKYPVQLSGGELQRAAIARALIFNPAILLADEPTGNLDTATSWEIVKLLQDINKAGTTILMATHNTDVVNSLNKRVVTLEKGVVLKDTGGKAHSEKSKAKSEEDEAKETKGTKGADGAEERKGEKDDKDEKEHSAKRKEQNESAKEEKEPKEEKK